jgi:acetyl-CoA carboxylase/biotin carboxylase 1
MLLENAKYCPAPTLVALCGAALQGYQHFEQRGKEFIDMLRVGQVPSKDTLAPSVVIDLIFNNVKYSTVCLQSGATSVIVDCNGGRQNIAIRPLADMGYLMIVNGKSHVAYSKQESGGSVRVILDGHTCIFTPEYDPTVLVSSGAGKLARLLVPDGTHLMKGEAYVEIEVMKMYMSLKTAESGTVHFQMSEGASLLPGDVIALVTLDDPDKVVKSEKFSGLLSAVSDEGDLGIADDANAFALPHLVMREVRTAPHCIALYCSVLYCTVLHFFFATHNSFLLVTSGIISVILFFASSVV